MRLIMGMMRGVASVERGRDREICAMVVMLCDWQILMRFGLIFILGYSALMKLLLYTSCCSLVRFCLTMG